MARHEYISTVIYHVWLLGCGGSHVYLGLGFDANARSPVYIACI